MLLESKVELRHQPNQIVEIYKFDPGSPLSHGFSFCVFAKRASCEENATFSPLLHGTTKCLDIRWWNLFGVTLALEYNLISNEKVYTQSPDAVDASIATTAGYLNILEASLTKSQLAKTLKPSGL